MTQPKEKAWNNRARRRTLSSSIAARSRPWPAERKEAITEEIEKLISGGAAEIWGSK